MEASFHQADLVQPWRRATIVASSVAAFELVLLLCAGALLLAKPLSHALHHHAVAAAQHAAVTQTTPVVRKHTAPVGKPTLTRAQTKVLVLNGNGENGAAHAAASKLSALGYKIAGAANAKRQDYATTVVMYRPGFAPEGRRLAQDIGAKVVGPLDGLKASALDGGQLAVVLGAN